MNKKVIASFLALAMCAASLSGCAGGSENTDNKETKEKESTEGSTADAASDVAGSDRTEEGDETQSTDELLESLDAYAGYFDGDSTTITVNCVSGTSGAYTLDGNTLTFTSISEDSVYSISGQLKGNIVIDVGDNYCFDLELTDFSLVSDSETPIVVKSGDEISLTAKKDTKNYVYDKRETVSDEDSAGKCAIYSETDLKVCGKGSLTVVSENNNGIHSKDDLKVKNLTLVVSCLDNALKGNDNVEITDGETTLIASEGDGIKTVSTKISKKGNQKGIVMISGGTHTIYAAKDGIDAAYDCQIDDENTILNIYAGSYKEGTSDNTQDKKQDVPGDSPEDTPAFNKDGEGFTRPDGDMPQGTRPDGDMPQGTRPDNSTGRPEMNGRPGMGGFNGMDGNPNKSDESQKGIKAGNEITINAGTISIEAYDDAVHANVTEDADGQSTLGNIVINGGTLELKSNDDAIHADGTVTVNGGAITIADSYEGIEGNIVNIGDGVISIYSSDDGINGTSVTETAVNISGGEIYIYCNGDGIDSNSRISQKGIIFSGGDIVIVSTSGGDSSIDTENGYTYEGGRILALMPSNGMTNEVTNCQSFSDSAKTAALSLNEGDYVTVSLDDERIVGLKMPVSLTAYAVYLGSTEASIKADAALDMEGSVCWTN